MIDDHKITDGDLIKGIDQTFESTENSEIILITTTN